MACLVRYVATSGNDSGTGCDASAPLLTIGGCISRLAPPAPPSWPPRYAAGGTCLVSPGTYHEGTADTAYGSTLVNSVNDLTIALAPESAWPAGTTATEVTIDGTMELTGWEAKSDAHGVYYRSTAAYGDQVWQLFVDGAPLTAARWPNADAWSDDAWSRARGWASQAAGSSCGVSVDKGTAEPAEGEAGHQSLAATGVSFNGCNVIMNNEHWITRRYTVANHAAGTGTFDYETDSSNSLCTRYGTDLGVALLHRRLRRCLRRTGRVGARRRRPPAGPAADGAGGGRHRRSDRPRQDADVRLRLQVLRPAHARRAQLLRHHRDGVQPAARHYPSVQLSLPFRLAPRPRRGCRRV